MDSGLAALLGAIGGATVTAAGYQARDWAGARRARKEKAREAWIDAREAWDQSQLPDLTDATRRGRLDESRRELTRLQGTWKKADTKELKRLLVLLAGTDVENGYKKAVLEAQGCWTSLEQHLVPRLRG